MYLRRAIFRHAVVSLSFVLLYLLLNRPEIVFFSRIGFVAWYPAVGLTMALMLGISPWYAILACFSVALAGRILYAQPVMSYSSTVDAAGIAACYGAAAYVLRGPLKIDLRLRRRRDVVRYLFISAVAAAGATIVGVACLIVDHSITWRDYNAATVGWFLGDAIGLAGIAPFLLVHVLPHVRRWLSAAPSDLQTTSAHSNRAKVGFGALAEACGQGLMIIAVCWAMFGISDGRYGHFYTCFIPIIWIAMRHGVRRVVTGLLALNFGIVIAMHIFPPTEVVFTKVALFMLVVSAVGLIVGSEASERHHLAVAMKKQTTYLDSLIKNNPLGVVVLDRQGRVELANSAFEKLFLYHRDELAEIDIGVMGRPHNDNGVTDSAQLIPQIFAGNAVHRTVRQRRKDGKLLDLALHGVPLQVNNEIRGAYLIYEDISEQVRALELQRRHAESLDLLVKELELRTKQMSSLNEMGALLQCSRNVPEAGIVVANFVQKLFPEASCGALYLFRSSRDLVEAAARWGKKDVLAPTFPPEACWSLRYGKPHWSERAGGGITCQHLTEGSRSESLCVAMVAQGNTIGVLHLEFEEIRRDDSGMGDFRESQQQLAISVASHIALSLASLQLREALREQSIRDPLTRLFNRRFLEESLERELQLASRKKQAVAVLFLDLDHFKRFNDTFGHDAGDMVLQSLADLLRTFFRATDICCRYGGEEFAIILPESAAQDAAVRADALRAEVKGLRLQYKKQPIGVLSLSAGVAAFPEHGSTPEDLLKIADRCLYESKARGRDIVTVASPQKV
ncbi:MAG: diguanylate cyclase [Candidatus Sulfotelmatobacter sp.]